MSEQERQSDVSQRLQSDIKVWEMLYTLDVKTREQDILLHEILCRSLRQLAGAWRVLLRSSRKS